MARWLIWSFFVIAWTVALELPVPQPGSMPGGEVIVTHRQLIAKLVHVSAYVLLAVLSAWVPVPTRYRWLMMFFVMCHAWGSEMFQEMLYAYCFREGKLSDVGFNVAGILIGVVLSWKWWTKTDPID